MAGESSNFTAPCVPKFDGDYDHWSLLMENLLRLKEFRSMVENGVKEPRKEEDISAAQQKLLDDARLKDLKAKNYLFQAIDKSILKTITHKATSKQLWEAMKVKYQGNTGVKRAQLQRLRRMFKTSEMKTCESITDYFGRVMTIANDMRNCGEKMEDVKIVEKVLRTLTDNFNFVVCSSIEESKDIDLLSVDELQSSLLVHEQKLKVKEPEEQALKVEHTSSREKGRDNLQRGMRGRGEPKIVNRATVVCYKCRQVGHFRSECPTREKRLNYAEFDESVKIFY
ncbi:unnamed protein product [Rhodiola kirilowii]